MRNVKTSVSQTYHRRGSKEDMGGLGAKLPTAGRFFVIFWEKLAILMPLDHNLHVFTTILKNWIFSVWKPIEKIKLFNLSFTYNLSLKHA